MPQSAAVDRTFVIADIRGYTRFTRDHGDDAAAALAVAFADLARDAVEARGGEVVELRGDEALCVFDEPVPATRAALELQLLCAEEYATHPDLPLNVGIGIASGEAVPVEDGYRGAALNLAAWLCANAAAGQVLVADETSQRLRDADDLRVRATGEANLKGFEDPVLLVEADFVNAPHALPLVTTPDPVSLADPELSTQVPLAGRTHEMRRLRGTWRYARRGRGAVLVLSGPSGIGKSRLAAELANFGANHGAAVQYVGLGGTAPAQLRTRLAAVLRASAPTILVVEDLDAMGPTATAELLQARTDLAASPTLVVVTVQDVDGDPTLAQLVASPAGDGGALVVPPLEPDGVRAIAAGYVDLTRSEVPLESFVNRSGGVPARVHEVVGSWARQEASRRLAAAAEWTEQRSADLAFANDVIGRGLKRIYLSTDPDPLHDGCPYLGLASFDADDASRFFGREELIGELAARSVGVGLIAVVGPSGAGKSSVVAAGLVPSLQAELLPGSDTWSFTAVRPGEHPMREWQRHVAELPSSDRRQVVVVDQFEELFTLCTDGAERAAFAAAIVESASDPDRGLVVLAIRGDHYASAASYPELAELVAANTVLVGPMRREELRRVVELPARRAGWHVESSLVDALVSDTLDQPGALPLLSTALVELWQNSTEEWLRLATYRESGGVTGAVARLAERSYSELTATQQEAARAILLRLVAEDDDGLSRRRVPLAEFDAERDQVTAVVLSRLTVDRLLTQDGTTVEVAHEALLREWPRLRSWLTEDAQGRQLRSHLTRTATQWDSDARTPDELYRGARLASALDWSTTHGRELNTLEREFLHASRASSEHDAATQRRNNQRLRGMLAGTAAVLVVALIAATVAAVQRSSAQENQRLAQQQTLATDAQRVGALSAVEQRPDLAFLLAAEGYHLNPSASTYGNLVQVMLRFPSMLAVTKPTGRRLVRMAAPLNGDTYAVSDLEGAVVVVDGHTGRELYPELSLPFTREMAYSADGETLYLVGWPNRHGDRLPLTLRAVDVATGSVRWHRPVAADQEDLDVLYGAPGTGRLQAVPGSDAVAWITPDGISVYAADSGAVLTRQPGEPGFLQVMLPRERILQLQDDVAVDRKVRVLDARTHQVRRAWRVDAPAGSVTALSRDGRYLAVSGESDATDRLIGILDLRSGETRLMHGQGTGWVSALTFSPDGRSLMSTDDGGNIDQWGVADGSHWGSLPGSGAFLRGVAFVDGGRKLVTTGLDGQLITWDTSNVAAFAVRRPRPGPPCTDRCTFAWMGMLPGTDRLALIEVPQQNGMGIQFVDGQTLRSLGAMPGRARTCCQPPAFSPDGALLAAVDPFESRLRLFDVATGRLVRQLLATDEKSTSALGATVINTVTYSSDGQWVATNVNEHVAVVDPSTGAQEALLESPGFIEWLTFSPDGRYLLASSEDGSVTVWRTSDWQVQWQRRVDEQLPAPATFSPDGTIVAAGSASGTIHILDASSGAEQRAPLLAHASLMSSMSFNPDGTMLTSSGLDGKTYLWDVATGRQIGQPFPTIGFATSMFGPDGSLYVNTFDDVYRLDIAPSHLVERACAVAARSLTDSEWQRYLPDRPRDDACLPAGGVT